MPAILLHAPAIDNGGSFRDAGSEIDIGADEVMIDDVRAQRLVRAGAAVDLAASGVVAGGKGQKKAA